MSPTRRSAASPSSLRIETSGELDLRGFLGIADDAPGYRQYNVRINGDGTAEQFRKSTRRCRTSPNYFNMSRPIRLDAQLVVEW